MLTSLSNGRVKNIIKLQEKSKARKEEDVFVVEGVKMFLEAPLQAIRETFIAESFMGKNQEVEEKLTKCDYEVVADDVFRKMSDTQTPQGILCVVKRPHYTLEEMLKEKPLLVVIEDLQDPGNLGTIMRTGEGAGITGVVMSRDTVDIYNPKTIRATMGSLYRVPFIYVENLKEAITQIQNKKIAVYAAHLKGEAFYDTYDYSGGTAFLIGNEGNGLKTETADLADTYLKIPMQGQLESLNAAVATAVLLYEASRQRLSQ